MKTEKIIYDNQLLAMIIYNEDMKPGIKFYTPDTSTLQVGKHFRKKGEKIKVHKHPIVKVERNENLQEVLYIESGKVKINFYSEDGRFITSKLLNKGDMILSIKGGHGFEMVEDTKMIEIKQGPYFRVEEDKAYLDEGK